jgi:hypothetical protein
MQDRSPPARQSLLQRTAGPYIWVKAYRPIEPIAQPDVPYTSKIGNGFAALRQVALGHDWTWAPQPGWHPFVVNRP